MSNASTPPLTTVQAVSASNFANNIGVNTHLDFNWSVAYSDLAQVANALSYLGVKTVRDSEDNPNDPQEFAALNQMTGIKFDFFVSPGSVGLTTQLQWWSENPSIIRDVEGANESDNFGQSYNGLSGVAAAEAEQAAIKTFVTTHPAFASTPIIQASFGQGSTFANVSGIAGDANYANAHQYFGTGNNPGAANQIGIVEGLAQGISGSDPMAITETGYQTQPGNVFGVSQIVQAKYTLDLLFDEWKTGVSMIDLYELVDEQPEAGDTNPENFYGLFNNDWTPKPAAIALHNLLTIFNESDGATPSVVTPGTLAYSVTNMPSGGNSELFQKADGTFVLALWNDVRLSGPVTQTNITVAPVAVTLNLGQSFAYVDVFDPLSGSAPIEVLSNTSTISLSLPDHPILIELSNTALPVIAAGPTLAVPVSAISTVGTLINLDGLAITDLASGTVTVTLSDAYGSLRLVNPAGMTVSGQSVDVTGTLAQVNTALATATYTASSYTGTDTISVYAIDGAGLSSSQSIGVTIGAAIGVPAATGPQLTVPANEQTTAGATLAVSGISLVDAYGSYNPGGLALSVSDTRGELSMTDWSGNTISGSGTKTINYTSNFINITAALASLTYTATTLGSDTISITIYDQVGLSVSKSISVGIGAAVSTPATPIVTTPVTTPVVTTPVVTTPVITTPVVTTPTVTAPVVTAPVVTTAVVTTPVVTTTLVPAATGIVSAVSVSNVSPIYNGSLAGIAADGTTVYASGQQTFRVQSGNGVDHIENFAAGNGGDTLQFANSNAVTLSDYHVDDILWNEGSSRPVEFTMNDGAVTGASFVGANLPAGYNIAGVGDFDGNGHADILWTRAGSNAYLWLTNSDGSVTPEVIQTFGVLPAKAWVGDFNGDGKSDILWDLGNDTPLLWEMNGGAVIGAEFVGADLPAGYQIAGVGDFNGDGTTDIYWTNQHGGPSFIWEMGAGGGLIGVGLLPFSPSKVWTGDFNGDGKADILWDMGNNAPILLTMNGTTLTGVTYLGVNMPAGFHIAAVGDFNGDGLTDVLWAPNTAGGSSFLWLTQPGGGVEGVSLAGAGGVPTTAFAGDFTLAGTKVTSGGTSVVLDGVDRHSLMASNLTQVSNTRNYSDFTTGVTTSLATGNSNVANDPLSGIQNLVGTAYNDTLEGKGTAAAPSTITGNGGMDTYWMRAGDGNVTVVNGSGAGAASGQVDFLGSLTDQNLWLQKSGNNLVADIIGTKDQLTIQNWYGNASSQVSEIDAGGLKLDTQLATLVQAMATYSGAHGAFNPQSAIAMPTDTTLQTAITAAWHS